MKGATMGTKAKRVDQIVQHADGRFPNEGKIGLCRRCGGDPTIATGSAAIGTAGCCCGANVRGGPDKVMASDLTTRVGETVG